MSVWYRERYEATNREHQKIEGLSCGCGVIVDEVVENCPKCPCASRFMNGVLFDVTRRLSSDFRENTSFTLQNPNFLFIVRHESTNECEYIPRVVDNFGATYVPSLSIV